MDSIEKTQEGKAVENVFKALAYLKQNDSINKVSTALFSQSIGIVNNSNNIGLREWVYSEVGFYYYSYNHYFEATPYFIKISKMIDSNLEQVDVQSCNVLLKTAFFFETMHQYDKCIDYYKKVLEISKDVDEFKATALWALGNSYLKLDSLVPAKKYFDLASKQALKIGDTLRYAKSLGGLASILDIEGDKVKAEQYFQKDISISKHLKEDRNLMYAQIQLGKFYFADKKYDLAEKVWREAYEISKSKRYLLGYQREILLYLLNIAKISNRDTEELFYRREIDIIDSIIEGRETEDVIRKINWDTTYQSITLELEAEKYVSERVRYQRLLFMSSTGLLLLLVFVVYFFYKRIIKLQMYKYEGKLLEFQFSKISSENKLRETHASLAAYQIYLTEKTDQIEKLEQELLRVKNSSNEYLKEKRPDLEQLLSAHLMTEQSWSMFKEAFKSERKDYFEYVTCNFPDLTESNLRIVLLQKLGLTNQETANLLGVTIEAVKKAKQRLKKRYEEQYDIIFSKE
ncbi:tetratricopeptide repeat protein [Myroides sp. LJL119]